MADPARAAQIPALERRKRQQAACRERPCVLVEQLLNDQETWPPCVLCVHESRMREALRKRRSNGLHGK